MTRAEITGEDVAVPTAGATVAGNLTVPDGAVGIVVFAHGSGSSRRSPRNRYVAEVLNDAGLATLLFDLLTPAEEQDRANVFDIDLLAERLIGATRWLAGRDETRALPVGYFGASTGGGAAVAAAADPRVTVAAVVSRGGRPDLAGPALSRVFAPTLLIVGARDPDVVALGRRRRRCRLPSARWRSFPVRPTCSRSPARWRLSPRWPETGSSTTWNSSARRRGLRGHDVDDRGRPSHTVRSAGSFGRCAALQHR